MKTFEITPAVYHAFCFCGFTAVVRCGCTNARATSAMDAGIGCIILVIFLGIYQLLV